MCHYCSDVDYRRRKGIKPRNFGGLKAECVKCRKFRKILAREMCSICYKTERRRKKGMKAPPESIRRCAKCNLVSKIHGQEICWDCYRLENKENIGLIQRRSRFNNTPEKKDERLLKLVNDLEIY
jgi:hypothetical protein